MHIYIINKMGNSSALNNQQPDQHITQQLDDQQFNYVYHNHLQPFIEHARSVGINVLPAKIELRINKTTHISEVLLIQGYQTLQRQYITTLLGNFLQPQMFLQSQNGRQTLQIAVLQNYSFQAHKPTVRFKVDFIIQNFTRLNETHNTIMLSLKLFRSDFLVSAKQLLKRYTFSSKQNLSLNNYFNSFFDQFTKLVTLHCHSVKAISKAFRQLDQISQCLQLEQYLAVWQAFLEIVEPSIQIGCFKEPYQKTNQSNEQKAYKTLAYFVLSLWKEKKIKGEILIKQGQLLKVGQNFLFWLKRKKNEEKMRGHQVFANFLPLVQQNLKLIKKRNKDEEFDLFLQCLNELQQTYKKQTSSEIYALIQAIKSFQQVFKKYFIHLTFRWLFQQQKKEICQYLKKQQQKESSKADNKLKKKSNLQNPLSIYLLLNAAISCIKMASESVLSQMLGPSLIKKYKVILKQLKIHFQNIGQSQINKLKGRDMDRLTKSFIQLQQIATIFGRDDSDFLKQIARIAAIIQI